MMNKKITFSKVIIQQKEVLLVTFDFDNTTKEYVSKFGGVSWSNDLKGFYVPFSKKNTNQFFQYLRLKGYYIDYSSFAKKSSRQQTAPIKKRVVQQSKLLSTTNLERFKSYESYLRGLRLSKNTIAVYSNFVKLFLQYIEELPTSEIQQVHFRTYTEHIVESKQYSISTHRQLIGALNHFSTLFLSENFEKSGLQRPKKNRSLPAVLSQEEVILLIRATPNLKHRAIIALLYSCGLRIGECINLKLADIDFNRMQLRIRFGKGRKDRYVGIAKSFIPLASNYLATYKPEIYFVEGATNQQYSASSIRKFLYRACQSAGITKKITPHTLRHSYATHLIENGVGLRHVQELLGHSKPETTMIYTHVAQKDLLRIQNPLDMAVKQLTKVKKEESNIPIAGSNNR